MNGKWYQKEGEEACSEKDFASGHRPPRLATEITWTEKDIKQLKSMYPTKAITVIA
jgi:hypothetical protein